MKIVNRDMSIAVLRAFAAKRQEEHEESLLKKSSKKKVVNGKGNGPSTAAAAEGDDSKPGASPVVEDPVSEEKPECSPPAEETAAAAASVEAAVEPKIAKPLHVLEVFTSPSMRISLSFYAWYLTWEWWNAGFSSFRIEGTSVCQRSRTSRFSGCL